MSPSFSYIGHRPEAIVGIPAGDISEAEYDALPWELQQAVLLNRGSNGRPLYSEKAPAAEKHAAPKETESDETPSKATKPAADTPAKEGT